MDRVLASNLNFQTLDVRFWGDISLNRNIFRYANGMYVFWLEETGNYTAAEKLAKQVYCMFPIYLHTFTIYRMLSVPCNLVGNEKMIMSITTMHNGSCLNLIQLSLKMVNNKRYTGVTNKGLGKFLWPACPGIVLLSMTI